MQPARAANPPNLLEHKVRTFQRMSKYYETLFPFAAMYRWLSYGEPEKFYRREFGITLMNDQNTFLRNISFNTQAEFMMKVRWKKPKRIDIGPSFNVASQKRSQMVVEPVERELIFDIDLSDYNTIRTCCKDATICGKCWKYAAIACKILDTSLREDFGWQGILWVFSGRRGIHCWVCDTSARKLSQDQRKQIVSYYRIGEGFGRKLNLGSKHLHHHLRRSFEIGMRYFEPVCIREQDILGSEVGVEQFLLLLPVGKIRESIRQIFRRINSSELRWAAFNEYLEQQKKSPSTEWNDNRNLLEEIVLFYTYARLDAEVTKTMNHLLKSPFSLHPDTFKICTPFDPLKIDDFDPKSAPSLYTCVAANNLNENTTQISSSQQFNRFQESLMVFDQFLDVVCPNDVAPMDS